MVAIILTSGSLLSTRKILIAGISAALSTYWINPLVTISSTGWVTTPFIPRMNLTENRCLLCAICTRKQSHDLTLGNIFVSEIAASSIWSCRLKKYKGIMKSVYISLKPSILAVPVVRHQRMPTYILTTWVTSPSIILCQNIRMRENSLSYFRWCVQLCCRKWRDQYYSLQQLLKIKYNHDHKPQKPNNFSFHWRLWVDRVQLSN